MVSPQPPMTPDPAMGAGVSPPQGLTATQQGMPTQAGPPPPSTVPMGMPMDPMMAGMGMVPPPQPPPKKPPTMIPSDIGRLLAEAMNNTKLEAARGLTEYLGDARGNVNARDADLVRVWRKRNPDIDPLYEKFINGKSDEEILYAMYPARRALLRYGRRTYTEQVEFAEKMQRLNNDPRFNDLDNVDEDEEGNDTYEPPQSKFPSNGEEDALRVPETEE